MASQFDSKESKELREQNTLFARVRKVLESAEEFGTNPGAYTTEILGTLDEDALKKRVHTLHALQRELAVERESKTGGWIPAWSPAFMIPTDVRELQDQERRLTNLSSKVEKFLKDKTEARLKKEREAMVSERMAARENKLADLEKKEFEPQGFFNKLFSNMMNGYFVDVLLPYEALELERKQEYLDELYKSGIQAGDTSALQTALVKTQNTVSAAASTAATLVDETSSGLGKGISLALAWPYALPVKLFNAVVKWALEKPSFMLGAGFEVVNDSIPLLPLRGNFLEEPGEFLKNNFFRILGNIGLGIVKAPFAIPEGVFKGAGYLFSTVRHVIDFDNWPKMFSPVTSGFIRGGLGVAVLVAVVLAGIPTLGIVPAMWAVGAGLAAAGSVIAGIWGAKKKAKELSSLTLPENEELQLVKWRRTHRPEKEMGTEKVLRQTKGTERKRITEGTEISRRGSEKPFEKPEKPTVTESTKEKTTIGKLGTTESRDKKDEYEKVQQDGIQIEGKPSRTVRSSDLTSFGRHEGSVSGSEPRIPMGRSSVAPEPNETVLRSAGQHLGSVQGSEPSKGAKPMIFGQEGAKSGKQKETRKEKKARRNAEKAVTLSYDRKGRDEGSRIKPSDEKPDAAPHHPTPEG